MIDLIILGITISLLWWGTVLRNEEVLVLRTCGSDLISRNGFKYPESEFVRCPDWKTNQECGNGLHGLLWGEGNGELLYLDGFKDLKYLVISVKKKHIMCMGKKRNWRLGYG